MKNTQYVDNSSFLEFCSEVAGEMTQLQFGNDTFVFDDGEETHITTKYTEEAQDYFNLKYCEVGELLNTILSVNSENDIQEPIYILSENSINTIKIKERIFDDQLFEYKIIDRKEFIDELINWISEAKGSNKYLMKADLFLLNEIKDDYIFSSISTNDYIYSDCSNFKETCELLLELNNEIK